MELPSFLKNSQTIYGLTIDQEGRIIYANDTFAIKVASSASELLGLPFAELIVAKDVPQFAALLTQFISGEKKGPLTAQLDLKAKGKSVHTQWEFCPGKKEITCAGYDIEPADPMKKTGEWDNIIINSLPGVFYLQDKDGKYLKWNKNFEMVSGYTAEEIPLLNALVFFDKKDHELIKQTIAKGFAEGSAEVEAEVITKRKEVIPYYFNKRAIYYDGKRCLIGTGIDMTQQVKAQQAMEQSENKYHSLFEQASDPIMITDFKGNFIDINTNMCLMFGYSKEELLKMNIAELIDPEQLKEAPIRLDLLAKGQHIFSNRTMIHRNGNIIYVSANVKRLGDNLVMAIARDVTELKKAEASLIAQEKQLRLFVEHSPAAIAMFDKDMRYINASHRWVTDYNLTGKQIIGRIHYEVFPGIPQRWKDIHQRCMAGATEKNDEDSFVREDGSIDWLRWEIHPWYRATGEIGGIIMLTEVITEKMNTELALKEAELKFRNLVEKSLVGVYIMQKGKFQYTNPVFAEIFGYAPGEMIDSLPVEAIVHEDDRQVLFENIRKRMEGEIDSINYEIRGLKKDGQTIRIQVFGSRTIYNGENAIIGTLIDTTEKRRMEQEILDQKIQEQKKITRAIILAQEKERNHLGLELHDNINQILVGTKLYLGVAAKGDTKVEEAIRYPLELIDQTINEIRLLTSRQVTPLKNINLKELIQKILDKLDETMAIKTVLVYDVPGELIDDDLKLNIYRIIQEQVNNIIKHSAAKTITILLNISDSCINIVVTDDGKGFVVTKKRKGIGISNMINRVESYNGTVAMDSSPGKGCEIRICIPY